MKKRFITMGPGSLTSAFINHSQENIVAKSYYTQHFILLACFFVAEQGKGRK